MDRWTGRILGLLLIFILAMVGVFLVTNTNLFGRGARQDPRFEDVGDTPAAATTDVEVPPGSGVSASSRHSATTRPDGTVWTWGTGLYGRLGDGSNDDQDTPVRVRGLTNVASIVSGGNHSLALRSNGTVWAWGRNIFGQLGDGSDTNRSTPVRVLKLGAPFVSRPAPTTPSP